MAMQGSAFGAVFSTYELAHEIFSYLSMVELVRAQGVCPQWKSVITGSECLAQTIFLKPKAAVSLLESRGRFSNEHFITTIANDYTGQAILNLHPALRYYRPFVRPGFDYDYNRTFSMKINAMAQWQRGQWEQAYITQPPCPTIKLIFWHGLPKNKTKKYPGKHEINVPGGIRLGDIQRAVCSRLPRQTRPSMLLWHTVELEFPATYALDSGSKVTAAKLKMGGLTLVDKDKARGAPPPMSLGAETEEWLLVHEAREGYLPLGACDGEKEWLEVDDLRYDDNA